LPLFEVKEVIKVRKTILTPLPYFLHVSNKMPPPNTCCSLTLHNQHHLPYHTFESTPKLGSWATALLYAKPAKSSQETD